MLIHCVFKYYGSKLCNYGLLGSLKLPKMLMHRNKNHLLTIKQLNRNSIRQ
jgi:hypothetical protein